MTISEIYDRYQTPPNLIDHQLRVAAVAKLICDGIDDFPETNQVLAMCLLHDMGNLAKFKLTQEEEWMKPNNLTYWQQKQKVFIDKYGADDHLATLAILKELNIPSDVIVNLSEKSLSPDEITDLPTMICVHSDQRVNPEGIVSLEKRAEYLSQRYPKYANIESFQPARVRLQQKLQQKTKTNLVDITEISAKDTIEELKSFQV